MMVQSPLELYTTFLGFTYYDLIWKLCSRFGIAYLPFLMLMINGIMQPFETAMGNGADIAFRRTFITFIVMAMVCYLAVAPAFSWDVKEITYRPICEAGAQIATPGDSGTTFDAMFQGLLVDSVKVPLLLGLVLDVASGMTYSLTRSMPCGQNIQKLMHAVVLTRFSQPLQNQIQHFNNQCYLPAKAMFTTRHPDPSTYATVLRQYGGPSDLSWMGSHVLSLLYYKDLHATDVVSPFPYSRFPSPLIEHNVQAGLQAPPTYGYPSCAQWWSDPQYGLEHQVVTEINRAAPNNAHLSSLPLTDRIVAWLHEMHAPFTDQETAADIMVRAALYDAARMQSTHLDTGGGLLTHMANMVVTLGQLKDNVLEAPLDQAKAQDILPIVQAVLIFLILLFYPCIMIAGNYTLSVFMGLSFLLFSLIFTSAIWHALTILHNTINNSLSYVNFHSPEEKPLFNNFFTVLYYVVPLLFYTLIAGAGVMLGDKLNGMTTQSSAFPSGTGGGASGGSLGGSGSAGNTAAEVGGASSEGVAEVGTAALL